MHMLLCIFALMYGCFYEYAFMNKCLYGPHSNILYSIPTIYSLFIYLFIFIFISILYLFKEINKLWINIFFFSSFHNQFRGWIELSCCNNPNKVSIKPLPRTDQLPDLGQQLAVMKQHHDMTDWPYQECCCYPGRW